MVPRTAWYVKNGTVYRHIEYIEWNRGYSKEDKLAYANDLTSKLKKKFPGARVAEVTSASTDRAGRQLSPWYINSPVSRCAETERKEMEKMGTLSYEDGEMSYIHFYCMRALYKLNIVKSIDVYADVFYNPSKPGLTQAEACAYMKLLDQRNELAVLNSIDTFREWFTKHPWKEESVCDYIEEPSYDKTWFHVAEGFVVPTEFSKATPEHLRKILGNAKVFEKKVGVSGDLYDSVKKLSEVEEDLEGYEWFNQKELAIVCSIGSLKQWGVLQDEESFNNYMKERVR